MPTPGDDIAARVSESGLTIYDDLTDRPDCLFDVATLETRLDQLLNGLELNYAIRTRAKVVKERVAAALGYPVPPSFKKTRPRFPGQNADVSVQMSNNFQVWNEEVDPARRYVFIRVNADGVVTRVKVLTGEAVALLDTTGTLTSKFQAKRRVGSVGSKLVSASDTDPFLTALRPRADLPSDVLARQSPTSRPRPDLVIPIQEVASKLETLVGIEFDDPGVVQDRNRGVVLQRLACEALGLGPYADGGQFPDILSQVLEIKLQLSPTVDLGLVSPDSQSPAQQVDFGMRHCDSRYAVVYGSRVGDTRVRIDAVVVSTGEDFFGEFQRFEGLVQNRKLQIPLPADLFEVE